MISNEWGKDNIRALWESITFPKEPYSNLSTLEQCERNSLFERLYSKGIHLTSTLTFKRNFNIEHLIFQEEVDAINSLQCSYEFRKYLFILLGIYKFYVDVQGYCELNQQLRGYAFETANPPKKYGNYTQSLILQNQKSGKPIQAKAIKTYLVTNLTFATTEGTPILSYVDPSELTKYLYLIKPPVSICSKCGKEYIINPKTKRDLCDDCYKEQCLSKDRMRKQLKKLEQQEIIE